MAAKSTFSKNDLKKTVKKHNRVLDSYLKDVFEDNSMLVVILKQHYLVEFLIDKIFESVLQKPTIVTKNRVFSFSDKIQLFEAMGLDNDDQELRQIIWGLNRIRNEFAHNPKFNLWSRQGSRYIKALGVKGGNNAQRLTKACLYLTGYLRTMWTLHSSFPIMSKLDDPERDLWIKGSLIAQELKKEVARFQRNKDISKLLPSTD